MSVNELYNSHIKSLSDEQRRELLELLEKDLSAKAEKAESKQHSIMELHGLGKEIWAGAEPDAYVRELRDEWKHRP